MHIAGPHIATINAIGRTGITLNAPHHFYIIAIIKLSRGIARRIVEHQHHFGMIARRSRIGAGENHIFHARTTHGFIRGFAHDPAQGFQEIGFAAAIGADNAGHAGQNIEIDGVDKGFEAGEAKAVKLHLLRSLKIGQKRLQHFLESGQRLIALQLVTIDKKGRG